MAIKTISLEIDAYDRLKHAKLGKKSFSAVVRHAQFDAPESSGSAILAETAALYNEKKGAPMGLKVYGPNLETLERAALDIETALKQVPSIRAEAVFADRMVGKPYLEIDLARARRSPKKRRQPPLKGIANNDLPNC